MMEDYLAKTTVDYKHVQTFQEFYSFLNHFRIWDLSNPAEINAWCFFVVGFGFVNHTLTSCKFLINSIFLCIWHIIFKNILHSYIMIFKCFYLHFVLKVNIICSLLFRKAPTQCDLYFKCMLYLWQNIKKIICWQLISNADHFFNRNTCLQYLLFQLIHAYKTVVTSTPHPLIKRYRY